MSVSAFVVIAGSLLRLVKTSSKWITDEVAQRVARTIVAGNRNGLNSLIPSNRPTCIVRYAVKRFDCCYR